MEKKIAIIALVFAFLMSVAFFGAVGLKDESFCENFHKSEEWKQYLLVLKNNTDVEWFYIDEQSKNYPSYLLRERDDYISCAVNVKLCKLQNGNIFCTLNEVHFTHKKEGKEA